MQYLGTPYVWGGAAPGGFDCSGLVMYVYEQIGVSLPHSSYAQWNDGIAGPDATSSQPGDLVFFDGLGHVGIYIGGGEFIHAPHTGDVVKISSLERLVRRVVRRRPAHPLTRQRQEPAARARIRASLYTFVLMRTTWNGSISFGLVNIPVGLAPATASSARQSDVSFRLLHRECLTPIQQKRWCPVHDVEVGPDELVRGWEVAKGQFVPIEDAELEALERRDESRAIEITRFVQLEEVDPVYFDRTYYLVPAGTEAQRRPYALLLAAMRETGMAGARLVRARRQGEAVPDPRRRATRSRWRRCSSPRT